MCSLVVRGSNVPCCLPPPGLCRGEEEWEEERGEGDGCQEEGVACGGGQGAVRELHQAHGGGETNRSVHRGKLGTIPGSFPNIPSFPWTAWTFSAPNPPFFVEN